MNPMTTGTISSNSASTPAQTQMENTKGGMSRWKAAGIHLGLSVVVAIGVVLLLYYVWYPQPFFDASGGKFLLMLLVGVDVVLGPLITLIIFDTKKKSLKFDLAIVALIQIAAICYGVYTMYLARPVFVVFSVDHFIVLPANDVEPKMLAQVTRPEFKSLSLTGPKYAYNVPQLSGTDLQAMSLSLDGFAPQFYFPYAEKATEAAKAGKPLADLLKRQPQAKEMIEAVLKQKGKNAADVVYFPMSAKVMMLTVLLDSKSGAIIAILPLTPA
jgi:hypothetical protein